MQASETAAVAEPKKRSGGGKGAKMASGGRRTTKGQASQRKPRARCSLCGRNCRKNRLHCRRCRPDEKPQIRASGRKAASYRERDFILSDLGYHDYPAYLASDLWRGIRERFLLRNATCFRCGEVAEQVHHRFYSRANLTGATADGLHAVCRACHELLEFDAEGNKLPLHMTAKQTLKAMKENKHREHPPRPKRASGGPQGKAHGKCIAEKCRRQAKKGSEHCLPCLIEISRLLKGDRLEERYIRR